MRAKNLKGSDVILSTKCTQMYVLIKEPVCDTVDKHFKTRAAARVISLLTPGTSN